MLKEDEPLYWISRATGQLEVLLFLSQNGATPKTRLSKSVLSAMDTLDRTIAILEMAGLVASVTAGSFPFRKTYSLTPLGHQLVSAPITRWRTILQTRRASLATSVPSRPRVLRERNSR